MTDLPWRRYALCAQVDLDLWHPTKGGAVSPAKSICARCSVTAPCLEYALAVHEDVGIYGGKTPRERRKIARERAA